jgi:hypothetical protein
MLKTFAVAIGRYVSYLLTPFPTENGKSAP